MIESYVHLELISLLIKLTELMKASEVSMTSKASIHGPHIPIVPKNTKKGAQRRKPSLSSNGPIKGLNGQNNGWKKKPRMATNTPRQKKKMSPTPKRLSDGYLLPSKHEWHRTHVFGLL